MSALLTLPEDRVARDIEHWKQVEAYEAQWRRTMRRRFLVLGVKCGTTYVLGAVLAWGSLALTGDWAPIAFWGGLLLSNAGPAAFGYAFWMREQGLWS